MNKDRSKVIIIRCLIIALLFTINLFSYTAAFSAIENLDEMEARKIRYITASYGKDYLEDVNNYYTWQPETLCYFDLETGHEVWVLVHFPDKQDIISKNPNTEAWSCNGAKIGFFTNVAGPWYRRSDNPSLGNFYRRWIVTTDGSGLKACEGYGRNDIPAAGFGWAHTEDAYYCFGSHTAEAPGSAVYKLFKNSVDNNNVITGQLMIDTSPINSFKKEIISEGITSDDSHAVMRDAIPDNKRLLPTPNPIPCLEIYFASLGNTPELKYHWGVARHIGPSTNNWQDPYGDLTPEKESYFHGVGSPGPTGSFIIGSYSGTGVYVLFKDHGSFSDGGPLWSDWDGDSFGENEEIVVLADGAGTPDNPYNNPYPGHWCFDRWGRYAVTGTYTDCPSNCPGTRIFDLKDRSLKEHYVFFKGKYDGQHHSWTGWTDYVVAVHPDWPTGIVDNGDIFINKWDASSEKAKKICNVHYPGYSGNYNGYPRPSQSPDGTKVVFAALWLNNDGDDHPYMSWVVAYYPHPPKITGMEKTGPHIRISWAWDSTSTYTTRGWPNEDTDAPSLPREIKCYHVWVSEDKNNWTELTTTGVPSGTNYYDIKQPYTTSRYYAVTSEEHSRLESRTLSNIWKVALDGTGVIKENKEAAPYPADPGQISPFWTTKPPAPSNLTIKATGVSGQYRLTWREPPSRYTKIRYYNIYYSTTGSPPADRQHRIASIPVGTTTWLDCFADPSKTAFYRITSVDRQGNEGLGPAPEKVKNLRITAN